MSHTARSFEYHSYETNGSGYVNGTGSVDRPQSYPKAGWLEMLHKQHVSARASRRVDVAQTNLLKKELVTFFSLYRRDALGRAEDLLLEWKAGRDLEDINRELKKQYQHNLFDLHELDPDNPIRNSPLQPIILTERLRRSEKDAETQRQERAAAEARCEQLELQNDQLRADLGLAVEEGIKYRESLREWAELEEKRMEQGTPGKKSASEANVDVGVLQREVEMLRESRQRDLAAAKENFSRELLARETDVQVLKDEYQKLLKAKNEQEAKAGHQQQQQQREAADLRLEYQRLQKSFSELENAVMQGKKRETDLTSHKEDLQEKLDAALRQCRESQESGRKLQTTLQLEKDKALADSSVATKRLEEENDALRQENEILLKAHHESKHTIDTLRTDNQEGREAVGTLQRKVLDLEETIRQSEVKALNMVSGDEVAMLKLQLDMLKRDNEELVLKNDELRSQNERERAEYTRNRSSIDSVSGFDETDSEMTSLDMTLAPAKGRAGANDKGPQIVMSSRSLGAMAKMPQRLADSLAGMTSAERFAAIKQDGITASDLAAALACCNPDDALAIFSDLPNDMKAEVLAALPEGPRRHLIARMSPEELSQLLSKCTDDERKCVISVMETDLLASVLALLPSMDKKLLLAQMPANMREAALLADRIRKMDVIDRSAALTSITDPAQATLVVAFLSPADLAPALDIMHRKDMIQLLHRATFEKQVATMVAMQVDPRSVAFAPLSPLVQARILLTVGPTDATLLLLSLSKAARVPVIASLPDHVKDAIQTAESIVKVPANERWDAMLKLDLEDQVAAMSWLLPKDILRMARCMTVNERNRLLKSLQPDVCAAMLEQMSAAERADALVALPQQSGAKVFKLLARASLVGAIAAMDVTPSNIMSGLSKEHMAHVQTAVDLTRHNPGACAEALGNLQPEEIAAALQWMDSKFTCAALGEMPLAARKISLGYMAPETRTNVLACMPSQNRARALNSMSPAHRSHALRTLSAHSVGSGMSTMSSAERNLVTASLPAAARRALLKAREFDKLNLDELLRSATEMSTEDCFRALPWMESATAAAAVLCKYAPEQQTEGLENMSIEDKAVILGGMQAENSNILLTQISLRLRIRILSRMTVKTAAEALNKMSAHDKKTTLSAMPLDMEDAIDSWQAGNLPDDAILGDTSMSGREDRVETSDKGGKQQGSPDAGDTTERRRSRGKKEVKNLLDAGLLAHAFPNVSRAMRNHQMSNEGVNDSDSD